MVVFNDEINFDSGLGNFSSLGGVWIDLLPIKSSYLSYIPTQIWPQMTPVSHKNGLKWITWTFTWYGKEYIKVHYRRIFEYGGSKKNRNIWQSGAIMARVKQKGKLGMWNLNFGRKNEDSQLHFHALETKVHKVMVFRRAKVVKSLTVAQNERYYEKDFVRIL